MTSYENTHLIQNEANRSQWMIGIKQAHDSAVTHTDPGRIVQRLRYVSACLGGCSHFAQQRAMVWHEPRCILPERLLNFSESFLMWCDLPEFDAKEHRGKPIGNGPVEIGPVLLGYCFPFVGAKQGEGKSTFTFLLLESAKVRLQPASGKRLVHARTRKPARAAYPHTYKPQRWVLVERGNQINCHELKNIGVEMLPIYREWLVLSKILPAEPQTQAQLASMRHLLHAMDESVVGISTAYIMHILFQKNPQRFIESARAILNQQPKETQDEVNRAFDRVLMRKPMPPIDDNGRKPSMGFDVDFGPNVSVWDVARGDVAFTRLPNSDGVTLYKPKGED